MAVSARSLLSRSADLVRTHGLSKQTHHASDGSMCVFGALERARAESDTSHEVACKAGQAMYDALNEGQGRGINPATFNDLVDTTVEDVMSMLGRAMRLAA